MQPRISIITLGVADLARSRRFYQEALALEISQDSSEQIVFFLTTGTCLALYPLAKLTGDISPELTAQRSAFSGITLAHLAINRDEVELILQQASAAGGTIVKAARETDWGGYSGYFTDPDGYHWEIAWADSWKFNADGSLQLN